MKKVQVSLMLLFILLAFFFNILGLMELVSIFITAPILFISLLIFIIYLNERNRFRGF
ncbi:hypothetical protein PZE06_04575 [Robertmurraya sp. DFI.2.37]|uniref:hypothetical protein n=1 Tax=Robertmurraya sp. DFI.2.37 TaxID=3031819 RepID=UPI00177D3AC3|nr:hypothetical protein [Robertmurraya sp. DFI.2.37]MDF1507457.1 hypothetical protein [Robertmurraya sp. DFI.2.37]